jgi:predicted nuclease of predicted toxin-antitoxin system
MKFLLDENIPKEIGDFLKEKGFKVESINSNKHKGKSDKEVFEYAVKNKYTIITFDADFCSFKKEYHYGIIKLNGKLKAPKEILIKVINYYKSKNIKDLFVQVESPMKMIEESKKYSKKNIFKQFRKMPIKLKIFI